MTKEEWIAYKKGFKPCKKAWKHEKKGRGWKKAIWMKHL